MKQLNLRQSVWLSLMLTLPVMGMAGENKPLEQMKESSLADRFSFNGYGTFGLMYLDDKNLRYSPLLGQDDGVENKVDFAFASVLGLQTTFKASDAISATAQITFKRDLDTFEPNLEWLFLKYQPNETWSFRAGRLAPKSLEISDYRLVGYSNLWVHPPSELYWLPLTSFDGVDVAYKTSVGEGILSLNASYSLQFAAKDATPAQFSASRQVCFNAGYEYGDLLLHSNFSYFSDIHWDNRNPLKALTTGLNALGGVYTDVADKLNLYDKKVFAIDIGASYVYHNILLQTELLKINPIDTYIFAKTFSWFTSLGYRYQDFTPYLTYEERYIDNYPSSPPTGIAAVDGAIDSFVNLNGVKTIGAGVRWDFQENRAFKLQVEHIMRDGSLNKGYGQIAPKIGVTDVPDSVNLLSATVDFIF